MPRRCVPMRAGWFGLFVVLCLCVSGCGPSAFAQGQIGSRDDCRHNDTQPDIAVGLVAVVIVAPDRGLCGALIVNRGDQPVRCRDPFFGAPTGTLGWPLAGGGVADLLIDAQSGVSCIRDSSATGDTVMNVTLKKP